MRRKGTLHERTNERTNERSWLPAALRRALAAIAAAEGLTMRELVVDAVRELVAAYPRSRDSSASERLECVWAPHRDAPSLLGDRPSRGSAFGGEPFGIVVGRRSKHRSAA